VTSRTLLAFVVGTSVLAVIALSELPSGLIAPFGGMVAGWLLGGGTQSPLRRWWLRGKLARAERELSQEKRRRLRRVEAAGFRVIDGGGASAESDEGEEASPTSTRGPGGNGARGPDGNLLN
jgi:hypothetical protein